MSEVQRDGRECSELRAAAAEAGRAAGLGDFEN